jgi:hypothetical protein
MTKRDEQLLTGQKLFLAIKVSLSLRQPKTGRMMSFGLKIWMKFSAIKGKSYFLNFMV